MSVEKTMLPPQDLRRVDVGTDDDLRYWTNRFGVSADRLIEAVEQVGSDVDAVARHLNA